MCEVNIGSSCGRGEMAGDISRVSIPMPELSHFSSMIMNRSFAITDAFMGLFHDD